MATHSWHNFRQKAARQPQRILLAEGEDPRVIKAARVLQAEKIALPWLVGSRKKTELLWKQEGGSVDDLVCVDPSGLSASERKSWAEEWAALPRNKRHSADEAMIRVQDPLILGCLHLKKGKVDGFIGGATRTTADTLRAVLNVIGLAPAATTLFGFFLLENHSAPAPGSLILLADCAVNPDPSAKQLSNIAVGAAAAYEFFLAEPPRVAFLSFSTLGSASHPMVDKVREALSLARSQAGRITFDGEWQADTALDPFSAAVKGAGSSPLAGKANVLIVPDLNSGNIAYKIAQRLGRLRAVGPVLWGTAQPANDLSRGCSSEDIIDLAALTALQAQSLRRQPAFAQKEVRS
ncbi:MAG: hypothetical protein A2992_02115 [Elusimicrobia bacterium RIFCSPLOWO2_01_FULL_59_12]|nr:MAG: hypothetical protein A2992_02115 [Elusimicrobia bacterium RIFCSPLOWO2_01_FULL_59_12]